MDEEPLLFSESMWIVFTTVDERFRPEHIKIVSGVGLILLTYIALLYCRFVAPAQMC